MQRALVGVVAGFALVVGSIVGLVPTAAGAAGSTGLSAGTISLFAGSPSGASGQGQTAASGAESPLAATFASPSDEAVSPDGSTVYIADMKNCEIQEVNNGLISDFAGSGPTCDPVSAPPTTPDDVFTLSGVPGPATSAVIGMPTGVAVDSSGNVYIVECTDYTGAGPGCVHGDILKVSGGAISEIVTPPEISDACASDDNAGQGAPWGIRVKGDSLYFSDVVNNVVDTVSTSGGSPSPVAGACNTTGTDSGDNGAATVAGLNDPTGIYVDNAGNLLIADSKNAVIREVYSSSGHIATVAGEDTAEAPGTLVKPFGVVEDSSGNLYIADYEGSCITEVSGVTMTTFAGTCGTFGANVTASGIPVSSALFGGYSTDNPQGGPSQLAFAPNGDLFVNDYGDSQIDEVQPAPAAPSITNLATSAQVGGSFTASVPTTSGEGTASVTSSSQSVCTVGPDGLTVDFVARGTCSLTAQVAAGSTYAAATGSPQSFTVLEPAPTAPSITNLATSAQVGGSFAASVPTTSGEGTASVTSSSQSVCTVGPDGLTVDFVAPGTCSLTAQVAAGSTYAAATGSPQSFTVSPVTSATTTPPPAPSAPSAPQGYWMVASDGGIF